MKGIKVSGLGEQVDKNLCVEEDGLGASACSIVPLDFTYKTQIQT